MSEEILSFLDDDLDKLSEILNPVAEKTAALEEGENRVVSILFLDLKGFTALSERLSSEDVKHTLDKVLTVFTRSIEKFGGYIDKYEGDLIMALFGAKIASETDTERAISAGLKMLQDLVHVNQLLKVELQVRIGINTGMVTTGRVGKKREGDFTVYGDAVNLASRMESNAPVNAIMIPEATRRLVANAFEFCDLGEIEVKGKSEPIRVYKVLRQVPKPVQRWERTARVTKSVCVGRDAEIDRISARFEQSCSEMGGSAHDPRPPAVGLLGPAGIGKSRLVQEFLERQQRPTHFFGFAVSYAQSPYTLWTNLLKHAFGITTEDTRELRVEKLTRRFAQLISATGETEQLEQARNVVGLLLGAKFDDPRLERPDPKTLQSLVQVSVRQTLEALATTTIATDSRPLILVLDDVGWMDEASLALFQHLLNVWGAHSEEPSARKPHLFLLLTCRPEFEPFRELRSRTRYLELQLTPLSDADASELVSSMLGKHSLREGLIGRVMERSGGNPFYLEEWVLYLLDKGLLRETENGWELEDASAAGDLPESVSRLILSRLDVLRPALKATLQRAAVIGHDFPREVLEAVTARLADEVSITETLAQLVVQSWLQPLVDEASQEQYFFKHVLTSGVCYQTLLKYNRRILHEVVARVMEERLADRVDAPLASIAHHYDLGEVEDKAIEFLKKAADQARKDYASEQAITLYRRLLEKLDAAQDDPALRCDSLTGLGEVYHVIGKMNEAQQCLDEALRLAPDATRLRAVALRSAGSVAWRRGDYARATASFQEALDVWRALHDDGGIAQLLNSLAVVTQSQGDYVRASSYYEESLAIFRRLDTKDGIDRPLNNLGTVALMQGDLPRALSLLEESLAERRKLGDRREIAITLHNLGGIAEMQCDNERAIMLHEESLAMRRELGDRDGIASSLYELGNLAREQGDVSRFRSLHLEGLRIRHELGERVGICLSLAAVSTAVEEPEAAAQLLAAAEAARQEIGAAFPPSEMEQLANLGASLRSELGDQEFDRASSVGSALTLDEAVDLALRATKRSANVEKN